MEKLIVIKTLQQLQQLKDYTSTPARRKSQAAYRARNLEKRREATRIYRRNNPDKVRESTRKSNQKRKSSLMWRLAYTLRNRTRLALVNKQKAGSAVADLGCTILEFRAYLESKFSPGMTWRNWSRTGWHLDHIIPLKNFDLSIREEYLKACHYTNIQPMWALDNLKKGAKYV